MQLSNLNFRQVLRSEVKQALCASCENFLGSLESHYKNNIKRVWSVLKQKSKSGGLPSEISMARDNPATCVKDSA